MAIKSIIGVICTCLAVASFNASAALIGVLPATAGGTDYQAYYDDVADLTWLANANTVENQMSWSAANGWAASLNVEGVTGWRLADTLQHDTSCDSQDASGSYGYNCTGSEMGNLFYNVLGGSAGISITIVHNANYDLFSNIQDDDGYWTATEWELLESNAWMFNMGSGIQHPFNNKDVLYYSWAVHDGDVSADADGDGVIDSSDNCIQVHNPLQRDTDADGYGNICDADLNQDLETDLSDFSLFRIAFSTTDDPDADFDGDSNVDLNDFSLFRVMFGSPPGPSATAGFLMPEYDPLDSFTNCTATYEWTVGPNTGQQFTNTTSGLETVNYVSGSLTGTIINITDGELTSLTTYNDGMSFKLLRFEVGAENVYLSTDCAMSAHPEGYSFDIVYDGMLVDQVAYFIDVNNPLNCVGPDSQKVLFTIQDVTIQGMLYQDAVIMWTIDVNFPFKTVSHSKLTSLGIISPTSTQTGGYSPTDVEIYAHGIGPVASGDIAASTGTLNDFAELILGVCN